MKGYTPLEVMFGSAEILISFICTQSCLKKRKRDSCNGRMLSKTVSTDVENSAFLGHVVEISK